MVIALKLGARGLAEEVRKVGQAGAAVVLGAAGPSEACMPRMMWNMRCEKVTPGTMIW